MKSARFQVSLLKCNPITGKDDQFPWVSKRLFSLPFV